MSEASIRSRDINTSDDGLARRSSAGSRKVLWTMRPIRLSFCSDAWLAKSSSSAASCIPHVRDRFGIRCTRRLPRGSPSMLKSLAPSPSFVLGSSSSVISTLK
jgi:hypothetical protein